MTTAEPSPSYERNVFINCPFDEKYGPILHAITFAVHLANLTPRSALEDGDSGSVRLHRIYKLIEDCKYGIHDLSRVDASERGELARFNMPFECGLFFGAARYGSPRQQEKKILVLESDRYLTQKVLSDISGNDPRPHFNDPAKAIDCVLRFLENNGVPPQNLPGHDLAQAGYAQFQKDLPGLAAELRRSKIEIESLDHWKTFSVTAQKYIEKRLQPRRRRRKSK